MRRRLYCNYKRLTLVALLLASLSVNPANAVDQGVVMSGSLIAPPLCKINEGTPIELNFERMSIQNIDGIQYRRPLNYRVACDDVAENHGGIFTLTLTGKPALFSATKSAVLTNMEGLAIQVFQNNQPFVLGVPIKISLTKIPILEAVPIKAANANLQENPFEATATLQVDYQ